MYIYIYIFISLCDPKHTGQPRVFWVSFLVVVATLTVAGVYYLQEYDRPGLGVFRGSGLRG